MGLKAADEGTPKLTLSKLPLSKVARDVLQTPPLHPSAAVPFHWEEAPGRPRPIGKKTKAARCLDLPPRLLHEEEAKITIMPSHPSLSHGMLEGRSLSLACTFSFRKGGGLGSRRWGSERKYSRDSFGFSQSHGDIFRSEDNVKITRLRRRRSFFSLSTINSKYLWGDIYASFKQAVPWKRSP